MNIMMNNSSSDDRGSGHHDQGQSPETHTHFKVKRIEYETSPPMLFAMSIGCVAVLVATVLGCFYMCADCDPCITCTDGEEPRLSNKQMTSLKGHEALIHRFTEYPELLQREENQKYIIQLTEQQMEDIYKRYCFYFVDIPSHLRRKVDTFQIKNDQPLEGRTHQALQRRTISDGMTRHHNTVTQSIPMQANPLTTNGKTGTRIPNHLPRETSDDMNEDLPVDRLRSLKDMLIHRANSTAQTSIQPEPGQVVQPTDSAKDISPELSNEEAIAEGSTVGRLLQTTSKVRTDSTKAASDEEYERRKRRDESDDEFNDELHVEDAGYADDTGDDTSWGFSDEDVAICSTRKVAYPVVLYLNAAGNLVQIIQSESHDQALANERCVQEYHTTTRGNLTTTCLTTYSLKQVYALNLATLQFGREIIKMTQCTPVRLL